MKDLKVVFMGTPDFAVNILQSLIDNTNVVGVVCQPSRAKDRHGQIIDTPCKCLADKYHLPVFQPEKLKEAYEPILELRPDIIITCAYGQIVPKVILDFPALGCINVHASLLPKYRGGAPIHWALMNGEKETGITIMYMNEFLDQGNIISQKSIPIEREDNLETMFNRLSILGCDLLLETLPSIINKTNKSLVQDESLATYAYNIKKEEEKLDFKQDALKVLNHIRALSPKPGAYFILHAKRIKVYEAYLTTTKSNKPSIITKKYPDGLGIGTNDYDLVVTKLQVEGRKIMSAKEFMLGMKPEELINQKIG